MKDVGSKCATPPKVIDMTNLRSQMRNTWNARQIEAAGITYPTFVYSPGECPLSGT